MNKYPLLFSILLIFSCTDQNTLSQESLKKEPTITNTSLVLLGTIQDAGYPQIGCKKECCAHVFNNPNIVREVVSLGLVDIPNNNTYLFEATPDIVKQMKRVTRFEPSSEKEIVDGIFLTHAHIGHYTGLMYLGKEATNAKEVPVFAMPRMKEYLTQKKILLKK